MGDKKEAEAASGKSLPRRHNLKTGQTEQFVHAFDALFIKIFKFVSLY